MVGLLDDLNAADFSFDLEGRIRNLGFPANELNCLFPLFETISNGMHAIEERFDRDSSKHGKISVTALRHESEDDEPPLKGFVVSDNGIGLNQANWAAFRKADTGSKLKKNGKGVGRLSWLKLFTQSRISSVFKEGGQTYKRSFNFGLSGKSSNPISNHKVEKVGKDENVGTKIVLSDFFEPYSAACPRKSQKISASIIGHFLKAFASYEVPVVNFVDQGVSINLLDFYSDGVISETEDKISVKLDNDDDDAVEFEMYHILLHKDLKLQETGKHRVFYVGDSRVVTDERVDNQLGLGFIGEDSNAVYVGIVVGVFLNNHVNQERTSFTFASEVYAGLHDAAIKRTKLHLSSYIKKVREKQSETAIKVVRENPQFITVTNDIPTFVEEHFSLGTQSNEQIYLEFSRHKRRQKRKTLGKIRKLYSASGIDDFDKHVKNIADAIATENKGFLAEYVVNRKEILELLSNSLAYKDSEKRDYFKEEVIHDIIIPLRKDSDDLEYEDHNLWLLDDRLAFYSYFKSDKPFNTFLEDNGSRKEPDVSVVFDRSLAFQREGQDEPVVIVEFKRPGKTDYDFNSSPVNQILNYVDIFRAGGSLVDKNGSRIKAIPKSTRFICFVIADPCENLDKVVRVSPAQHKSADGEGYFGYSPEHNAFVEVLPYSKMLNDAKLRNEAFFDRLGLTA